MFDEFDDTDLNIKDDDSSSDEDAPKEMGIGKVSVERTIAPACMPRHNYHKIVIRTQPVFSTS